MEPATTETKVKFFMNYELPYSILGKVIGKLKVTRDIEKKMSIQLENIKKALEE